MFSNKIGEKYHINSQKLIIAPQKTENKTKAYP